MVSQLETEGIRTYLLPRDIGAGDDWQRIETENFLTAKVVLVFLGSEGWGPTHERLVDDAIRLAKVIIPVLVGTPPDGALARGRGIFRRLRYFEVPPNEEAKAISQLAARINQTPFAMDRQFDALVAKFVDGSEEDRLRSLQRVRSLSFQQRIRLAVCLRNELNVRFGGEQTLAFRSPPRPLTQIPGIRSWLISALIWSDAESKATRKLIENELPAKSANAYWVLSQLYLVRATYLNEIAMLVTTLSELTDDARLLASVVLSSSGDAILDLRRRLESDDFQLTWPALRVMRVIPIPDLLDRVCELFLTSKTDSSLAYDSLYALCGNPGAAAKILAAAPGVEVAVRRIAEIARLPNVSARVNFAVVLAAFTPITVDRCLDAIEAEPLNAAVARDLRAYLRVHRRQAEVGSIAMPGFNSDDINARNDFLGIDRDVKTLTSIMISTAVKPPLAIGLFGDWGNGKSHFMQCMENEINVLCERAVASNSKDFCHKVVQIRFNAWHYADATLWASLVNHILEQLAEYVNPSKCPSEQRQDLLKDLESARDLRRRVEAEKSQFAKDVQKRSKQLQDLHKQRAEKQIRLRDLKSDDLQILLAKDTDAKRALEDALTQLGAPFLLQSAQDLSAAVIQLKAMRTRLTLLFRSVFNTWHGLAFYALLVVVIVIPIVPWIITIFRQNSDAYTKVVVGIVSAVPFLALCTKVIRAGCLVVTQKLTAVENAKARVDELLAGRRAELTDEETQLRSEIAVLSAEERLVVTRLTAASARVTEIEERMNGMEREFSLARFLVERLQTDDYRKHLGLISLIRRDFTSLRDRLLRRGPDGEREVDRVVLYIDDLDRCTPETVMSVLQAVHLLLAFDLFVVVVGVDPRWLMHALREEYSLFSTDGRTPTTPTRNGQPTPQDYLEKIFQIPYCLPRMTAEGFERMVRNELAPTAEMHGPTIGMDLQITPPELTADASSIAVEEAPTKPASQSLIERQFSMASNASVSSSTAELFEVAPDALILRPWETIFAARLESLVHTPRAVKRFANIYRILKASVEPARLIEFEGVAEMPGDFQVPMTLLAMLIGSAGVCVRLFPHLLKITAAGQDARLFMTQDTDSEEFLSFAMREKLRPIVGDPKFPSSADVFVYWLPLVARFSFDVHRALNGEAIEKSEPLLKAYSTISRPAAK